jgi:SAM-dependent methyltransferase
VATNRFLLAIYDPWVLGFMARADWRSPIPPVVERYRRLLGRRHLDVGPGTGYFLDKAAPPAGTEFTLLDPNPNVLAKASRRLAAMQSGCDRGGRMKPLPLEGRFDSAALSYVLHCLRGPQANKAVAIRNIADDPTAFCSAGPSLGLEERHTPQARAVLRAFNRAGDFDNLGDTAEGSVGSWRARSRRSRSTWSDRPRTSRPVVLSVSPGRSSMVLELASRGGLG